MEATFALKEWAVACLALEEGRQILVIRKGGIREEGGRFEPRARAFYLLPTYEHQDVRLLRPEWAARLAGVNAAAPPADRVRISTWAEAADIVAARDEAQVARAAEEHIWLPDLVRNRFDFNAYDPLYLLTLRVWWLRQPVELRMLPEYVGCRSWVELSVTAPTPEDLVPAVSDEEFEERRGRLAAALAV